MQKDTKIILISGISIVVVTGVILFLKYKANAATTNVIGATCVPSYSTELIATHPASFAKQNQAVLANSTAGAPMAAHLCTVVCHKI